MATCRHERPDLCFSNPHACDLFRLNNPFRDQFTSATTDSERIALCLAQPGIRELVEDHVKKAIALYKGCQCGRKDDAMAAKCRAQGNSAYKKKNFEAAIKHYNDAIRFALDGAELKDSQELAFAYGNRSAVFFQLKQYEHAVADVDDAIVANYSGFKSSIQLELRKAAALINLGRFVDAKQMLEWAEESMDLTDPGVDAHKKRLSELLNLADQGIVENNMEIDVESIIQESIQSKLAGLSLKPLDIHASTIANLTSRGLFKENESLASFSSKVKVCLDPVKGRCIYAAEDIAFGEVVAVTKPFASVIRQKQECKYCHHCSKEMHDHLNLMNPPAVPLRFYRFIPCPKCPRVLYCSNECQSAAWELYHRFECDSNAHLLPLMQELGDFPHLALRLLFINGSVDRARQIIAEVEAEKDPVKKLKGPINYGHVYQLVHHSDKMELDQFILKALYACVLMQMAKVVKFFKDTPENESFAGGLILRHLLQANYNSSSNSFGTVDSNHSLTSQWEIATYLCPAQSLLNHSCNENIEAVEFRVTRAQCKLVKATRPISAGDELCVNYGVDRDAKLSERQAKLESLSFRCACEICVCEERDLVKGQSSYRPLGCLLCGELVVATGKDEGGFQCKSCGLMVDNEKVREQCEKINSALAKAYKIFKIIEDGKDYSQLAQLDHLITGELQALLCHKSRLLSRLYERLAKAYLNQQPSSVESLLQALKHVQTSTRIVELCFGTSACLPVLQSLEAALHLFANVSGPLPEEMNESIEEMKRKAKLLNDQFYADLMDD